MKTLLDFWVSKLFTYKHIGRSCSFNLDLISDVFGHKSNVSLVFDYMDTDMEVLIKDTSLVLTPANVKAYALMTLKGLEYLHNNWILHRVLFLIYYNKFFFFVLILLLLQGSEAKQLAAGWQRRFKNWRFWSSKVLRIPK